MSAWTHAICGACWNRVNPDRQVKGSDFRGGDDEKCCWCAAPTVAGIYLRADPKTLPCAGVHPEAKTDG